jgi:ABC-type Mn2+/Zn2+ transport system permease subunit
MTLESLVLAIGMAITAGLVGCFAVMRRMSLAADPLSHVALPGIGIALALHIHPLVGATATLCFGALIVWALEERARETTETIIGVVFSAALAVGSLLTTGDDLIEALFGAGGSISHLEVAAGLLATIAIGTFTAIQRDGLVVMLVSPDLARTAGVNVRRLNLLFLIAFALTIALGLHYLGVLLMGALIIIPAATARRLAHNLTQMLVVSVSCAAGATLSGSVLAAWFHRDSGPLIVLVAASVFLASLVRRL